MVFLSLFLCIQSDFLQKSVLYIQVNMMCVYAGRTLNKLIPVEYRYQFIAWGLFLAHTLGRATLSGGANLSENLCKVCARILNGCDFRIGQGKRGYNER